MTILMKLRTSAGRVITIPITSQHSTERQCDGEIRIDWSAEPDSETWIAMLAPRLAILAPEYTINQVYRDLVALSNGDRDAWLMASERYSVPHATTTALRNAPTEAARLLVLHMWLDEAGV